MTGPKLIHIVAAAIVAACCVYGSVADAAPDREAPRMGYVEAGISAKEATEKVRNRYGGRVLSTSPVVKNGKRGYTVRVLLDGGRVKTVHVDSSGNIR